MVLFFFFWGGAGGGERGGEGFHASKKGFLGTRALLGCLGCRVVSLVGGKCSQTSTIPTQEPLVYAEASTREPPIQLHPPTLNPTLNLGLY